MNILDIGALGGSHPRWKNHNVIQLEPDERAGLGDNIVLSDKIEKRDFYIYKKKGLSSLYKPNIEFLRQFPDVERYDIVETKIVETRTLDSLKKNLDFIKIDAQGAELPILMGGVNTLKNVIGIEVEANFVQFYKDTKIFPEVHAFLISSGFALYDFLHLDYWKRGTESQLIWGDALYLKPEHAHKVSPIYFSNRCPEFKGKVRIYRLLKSLSAFFKPKIGRYESKT